jgi:hypothetical protein
VGTPDVASGPAAAAVAVPIELANATYALAKRATTGNGANGDEAK